MSRGTTNGAAGGSLTGTYPNPTIGNNVITGGNIVNGTNDIQDGGVTATDIAAHKVTSPNMAPGHLHAYVAGADPATTKRIFVSVPAGTYILYGHATVTNECAGSCDLPEAACSIEARKWPPRAWPQTVSRICRSTGARGSTPRVTSPSPASVSESS